MANLARRAAGPLSAPRHGRTGGWLAACYERLLADADVRVDGTRPWDLRLRDGRLWQRLLWHGTLGFGDAYVDGWWDASAVDELVARLVRARLEHRVFNLPKRLLAALAACGNLQTLERARRVGEVHYDLDEALYRAMLGDGMVYTCAYWERAGTLAAAQDDKLELVCRKLELAPGMRVLDIGCGWGGFARHAASRHGVSVVGITIASEQAAAARRLVAGLPVEIQVCDYRQVQGRYDRVVSLGMFEHVGRKNYLRFLDIVRRVLVDDGLFLLHTIGLNERGSGIDPWVTRRIFPNSEVPTLGRLAGALEGRLRLEDWQNFGPDYARTLCAWHDNFAAAWPCFASRLGERFYRAWSYYLLMFAGVFRARGLDLWQLVLSGRGRQQAYRRPHF